MSKSYKRLSYPFWEGQGNPDANQVPDSIMVPLLDGFLPQMVHVNNNALRLHRNEISFKQKFSSEDVFEFSRAVWRDLGGQHYADILDAEIKKNPVQEIPADHDPHMISGGSCSDKGILFRFNGTVLDAVYFAHETGHLVATRVGYAPKKIAEIQAYFIQEAAYDLLAQRGHDAGRLHRFEEYAYLAAMLYEADQLVSKGHPANEKEDALVFDTHRHPIASVLAMRMYKKFQTMNDKQKENALNALFDGGPDIVLEDALRAFGLVDKKDFEQAGESFGIFLQQEAVYFGYAKNRLETESNIKNKSTVYSCS